MKKPFLLLALIASFALTISDRVAAQTLTTLYSFTNGTDGGSPNGGLIALGNTLYGTTPDGGSGGAGTVFAVNTNGTGFTTLYSFTNGTDGGYPSDGGLIVSGNILYGTTQVGGSGGEGTVFAVNTDGTGFATLYSFTYSNQASPNANLILSGNTLYGTAQGLSVYDGGPSFGMVFAVNTDGTGFRTLYSFSPTDTNGINSDGSIPNVGLVLSDNFLYGTTQDGGNSGHGTVFRINTGGTGFTVLHSFNSTNEGRDPFAGVILSGDTLYGVTHAGGLGTDDDGTVFALKTNGTGFATLFDLPTGGGEGVGGVILSGNILYGTTENSHNTGTVFASNTNGTGFTTLHFFTGGADGGEPPVFAYSVVTLSANTLYGVTQDGSAGYGTVFSLSLPSVTVPQNSLQVTITPTGAVSAGAQWQVDNGTWQSSGATVSGLSLGTHTVSFNTILGWTTPANQTVSVVSNITSTASGTYVELLARIFHRLV